MKVVTFGEIMLRLCPKGYNKLLQDSEFVATFGGGEANVAVGLQNFGVNASFVSKLPLNDIGDNAIASLHSFGIETKNICRGGERMGIYFLEKGASVRPSKVIYDRKYSAFSEANLDDFDWNEIFEDCDWFHFTGITPALSQQMENIVYDALTIAKSKGAMVSCDLNYRNKLWSKSKAKEVMTKLMSFVDVLIGNEEDAENVFGLKIKNNDVYSAKLNKDGYAKIAEELVNMFDLKAVAFTLRESISASDNTWGAMLFKDGKATYSKLYNLHIVDRVGGGDSFASGLIYGFLNNFNDEDIVNFAVANSALKQTIEGDFNRVKLADVLALMTGDASGRVQR